MKIAFIGLNLYTYGGIQRVVCTLCNELCVDNDITVLMPPSNSNDNIFGLDQRVKTENLYNYVPTNLQINTIVSKLILKLNGETGLLKDERFSGVLSRCLMNRSAASKLTSYINDNHFDLVIALEELYSFYLGRIKNNISAKTIGWMHDTYNSYFGLKGKHSYGLESTVLPELKKLDALIALTDFDSGIFAKKVGRPVYTLYNPVPFKEKKQHIEHDGKNLLFVGRLVNSHKGLDHLLKIVKILSESRDDISLTIVGDGPDRDLVQNMVKELNLSSIVKMIGKSSQVEKYYECADALLHTSNYEGFGVVIVEAMACGVPVFAFENAGPNEIIHDGVNGFIIPKYDYEKFAQSVDSILDDSEKWNIISKAAQQRAKDFYIPNFYTNAMRIFDTVLAN